MTRFKASSVTKGSSQILSVEYCETLVLTPAASSIRLLVATFLENDPDLFHLDEKQGFVQSDHDTEMFMCLPPGCD